MIDDRPKYRVLATPFWTHDHAAPEHPDGGHHTLDCVHGFTLEIYRTDVAWRLSKVQWHEPLFGTTYVGIYDRQLISERAARTIREKGRPEHISVHAGDMTVYVEVLR